MSIKSQIKVLTLCNKLEEVGAITAEEGKEQKESNVKKKMLTKQNTDVIIKTVKEMKKEPGIRMTGFK